MNFILFSNFNKQGCNEVVSKIINKLVSLNADIFCESDISDKIADDRVKILSDNDFSHIDAAIVVGGDGTIIKCCKKIIDKEIPVLGVNLGKLGFLAGIEKNEIDRLSELVNGKYETEERMVICAEINGNRITALNDIVISKSTASGIINFDIKCSEIDTAHYRADGIIFSTPSGSTAYAMAAGGPIIHPSVKAISFTPICAHSLFARSIILPKDEIISISTDVNDLNRQAFVIADGLTPIKLKKDDTVFVKRYEKNMKFIKLEGKNYYSNINKKLMDRG